MTSIILMQWLKAKKKKKSKRRHINPNPATTRGKTAHMFSQLLSFLSCRTAKVIIQKPWNVLKERWLEFVHASSVLTGLWGWRQNFELWTLLTLSLPLVGSRGLDTAGLVWWNWFDKRETITSVNKTLSFFYTVHQKKHVSLWTPSALFFHLKPTRGDGKLNLCSFGDQLLSPDVKIMHVQHSYLHCLISVLMWQREGNSLSCISQHMRLVLGLCYLSFAGLSNTIHLL